MDIEKAKNVILIVDDDAAYLNRLIEQLSDFAQRRKMMIVGKSSATQARSYMKSKSGDATALAIVDILLPTVAKAVNLLRYLKRNFLFVRIIAITGYAAREDVGRMGSLGLIDGYIDKEWDFEEIKSEIHRVLAAPCSPAAHTNITQAIRRWLEQNPRARRRKIRFMDPCLGDMRLESVLKEIEAQTEFGKRMERILYQFAFDMWAEAQRT